MCKSKDDCCKKPEKQEAPRPSCCCGEKGCHDDKEKGHTCCCDETE